MASGASSPAGLLDLSPHQTHGPQNQTVPVATGVGVAGLRKLCVLLKNEGDKVLSGRSIFTLSSEVLSHLLVSCRRHSILLNEQASAVPDPPIRTPSFVISNTAQSRAKRAADNLQNEWNHHIQFVKDFMLSTPSLKVLHNQGTLSFPISLHRFGNVSTLHLQRVPIHMVEGLQTLRSSLVSLTVYRGVNTLKDLLEACGGDRSAPLTWAKLKVISLVFNTISELDDSLRLLPHVEALDLSHNCLEQCGVYLEYLCDLVCVSLAYNQLKSVPSFSLTSRASLTSLVLRGNNLDKVKGIEELRALIDLDLGENCISDHSFLEPLVHLTWLRQLQLDGNPVFYHRKHRPLTASCLSRQALWDEFVLDKRKLTLAEMCYFGPRNPQGKPVHHTPSSAQVSNTSGRRSSTPERGPSPSSGIGTENESQDIVVQAPRKSRRKRMKARQTEILDTSGDFMSGRDVTPGSTPCGDRLMRLRTEEALKTKEEVEQLRKDYGVNWLQAIEHRNIFNKDYASTNSGPPSGTEGLSDGNIITKGKTKLSSTEKKQKEKLHKQYSKTSQTGSGCNSNSDTGDEARANSASGKCPASPPAALQGKTAVTAVSASEVDSEGKSGISDSDVQTKPEKEEILNPIMAALAKLAAGESATDEASVETVLDTVKTDDSASTGDFGFQNSIVPAREEKSRNAETMTSEPSRTGNSASGLNLLSQPSSATAPTTGSVKQAAGGMAGLTSPISRLAKQMETLSPIKSGDETSPQRMANSTIDGSSGIDRNISTDSSTDIQLEEPELTESLFASLPLQNNKMVLVSWSQSYLVEKDITGKLTEKLELKSLLEMESRPASENRPDSKMIGAGGGTQEADEFKAEGMSKDSETSKEGDGNIELVLKFDYINKDRQKRFYLLDASDAKVITDHLQPFLAAREEEARAKLMMVMQCLKCNRTFLKSEVLKKGKNFPSSGSLADLKAVQEFMDKTTFMCPKCGSSIVIEIDPKTSNSALTGTTASTSSQQGKSASSTPVGSFNSTEGSMEKARPTHKNKLRKMKSLDRFDLPTRFMTRRDSSDSLHATLGRTSSTKSSGSLIKDTRSGSTTSARERSNAFSAKNMTRSVAVTKRERAVSEQEELMPVEDYFAEETMTSVVSSTQLAAMTCSLRGDVKASLPHMEDQGEAALARSLDASTLGKTSADAERKSLAGKEEEEQREGRVFGNQAKPIGSGGRRGDGGMADSGFESGTFTSQSLRRSHIASSDGGGVVEKGKTDSNEEDRSGSSVERGGRMSDGERGDDKAGRKSTASEHRHLQAMEELVNSIVNEGHAGITDPSSSGDERGTNTGQKSMSVSAFRDLVSSSPSYNRQEWSKSRSSLADLHNTVGVIPQRSDSASSIAVLSQGTSPSDQDTAVGSYSYSHTMGGVNAAAASAQTKPDSEDKGGYSQEEGKGENEAVPRVVSPLSSDICSSMVSSVYESSVKTVGEDNIDGLGSEPTATSVSETGLVTPVIVDSSDSNDSSEELTSIYDMPRKPKNAPSSKKSSKAVKHKHSTARGTSDKDNFEAGAAKRSDISSSVGLNPDLKSNSNKERGSHDDDYLDTAAENDHLELGNDNTNDNDDAGDSSDEDQDLDLTPQYAFHHLNHRLTLFLMMTLFEPQEEFVCKIQGEICQCIIEETYEGIFVMSSARFYILKITSDDHSQDPASWLNCIEIQPIPELRYIDLGLGGQSLRLEFVTDCSSYTIITRNRDRTVQFVDVLHTNLAKYAVSHGIASHVVVNEDVDQVTLDNLDKDVLSKILPDQKLLLYCMGFIERGNMLRFPVSFVISTSDMCLVRTCHQWPQPRLQAPITIETVGRQFVVLERQLVSNVAAVNVDEMSMRKISLELFNEKEGDSSNWNIILASRQTTADFVHALSIPWEREFGVEMDVGYCELDF